ncbi:unnamed protein product [Ilex paraguariensis]|uniref:Uncharacterized protein n=1 Tax=Ilex paraguariensis TaxID=185542 RepID=A0ABC8U3Z8_9AQUA
MGDNSSYAEESTDFVDNAQRFLVGVGQNHCSSEQPDDQKLFDLPVQYDVDSKPVKHEYIGESSKTVNPVDEDYLLDEPFLNASNVPQFDDGAYLEANDLSNPIEADAYPYDMFEEYLNYFDAVGDNMQCMGFNSSNMMESDLISGQASLTQEDGGVQQVAMSSQELLEGHSNDIASSPNQVTKFGSDGTDVQHPFVKQANRMLGSIPAPPAFASEFPTKAAALCLNSASQSSSSVHVTAGMIQIRYMNLSGSGADWSLGKHSLNIVISFDMSHADGNSAILGPMVSMLYGKAGSAISRAWFCFMFIGVLMVSMAFKIWTCICVR